MRTLATIFTILLTSVSFSQSDGLVNYRIDATTIVNKITVIARESRVDGNNAVGHVESIQDSSINLVLNPNRAYTVIINGDRFVDIEQSDIASFQAKQMNTQSLAELSEEKKFESTKINPLF